MTFLLNIQDCEILVVIGVISLYVQQEKVPTKNQPRKSGSELVAAKNKFMYDEFSKEL